MVRGGIGRAREEETLKIKIKNYMKMKMIFK
jgi:hypothetical protein